MTTAYKSLNRAESYCSLNSSSSSHEVIALEQDRATDGATSLPPQQRPLIKKKSVYVFRCRYCKDTFTSRQHGSEGLCGKAPNFARENVDRLCIVRGYRGCWYHLTKDQLPHDDEEYDDVDINILRLEFPQKMAISLWVKFILISIFCFPCICLWIPFALWERHTRFVFGPRHSIRRKRKIDNTTKNNQPPSVQQNSQKEEKPSLQVNPERQPSTTDLTANSAPVPTDDVQITIEPEPSIPPPPPDVPPPAEEDEPTNEVEGFHAEDEDMKEDTSVKVAVLA